MCKQGKHNLEEIFSAPTCNTIDAEAVVRWCSDCGSVVVDIDYDGRTQPGGFMKMKFPSIVYGDGWEI